MSEEQKKYEKINFTFPVSIEWIIEEEEIPFSDEDAFIASKIYNVPGFPWLKYIIFFYTNVLQNEFSVNFNRLGLYDDNCEWENNLCLTINNGEPKKVSQKFEEERLVLHEGPIEELEKSKKCILDPVILRINGTITVHEISRLEDCCSYIPLSYEFGKLKEPKDFIIEVDNQEIEVHKKVLRFYSPVFSAMFENGWKEASEGRVVIPEFPFKIVKAAVDLCYGKWIKSNIKNPKLILLYRFADKYDMDEIKNVIKEIIILTPNNICEYANLFHAENCPLFVNHCIDRLIVYFQFSYPVKDLETLNNDIKLQFFTQASSSQAMKKEFMPDYHKNLNDEEGAEALP